MNEQEIQAFFETNGCYPCKKDSRPPRPPSLYHSTTNAPETRRNVGLQGRLALKGWRTPLHWDMPPAFEKPGWVYATIGHEAYLEAVKEYWESIGLAHVSQAERIHDRWAVRQVLKNFEAHVRGFRKQDVGRRDGRIFAVASSELTLPEDLVADGRLVHDLRAILMAYGVHDLEASEQLVKARLTQKWGVPV